MTPVIFSLPAPVPAARARSNGAHRYHDPKAPYAIWRAAAAPIVNRTWVEGPLTGPVELRCAFIFPRPKNRPAWCPADVWRTGERFRRLTLPDVDNCLKAVMDALQVPRELRGIEGVKGYGYPLHDDGCVVDVRCEKWIASTTEQARTLVLVRSAEWR